MQRQKKVTGRPEALTIDDVRKIITEVESGSFACVVLKNKGINHKTFYDFIKRHDSEFPNAEGEGLSIQLSKAEKKGRITQLKIAAENLKKERLFTVVTKKTMEKGGVKFAEAIEEKTIDNTQRDVAYFNALVKVNELIEGQTLKIQGDKENPLNVSVSAPEGLLSIYKRMKEDG